VERHRAGDGLKFEGPFKIFSGVIERTIRAATLNRKRLIREQINRWQFVAGPVI
jgi:hypothetical protein